MRRVLFVIAFLMALAAPILAQTTGSIDGTVVDENKAALPGVNVEATSPSLQGSKVAITDTDGRFRLPFLPPGVYNVKFTLASYSTIEHSDVRVALGRTVSMSVEMRSAFQEAITVSGEPPTIDVTSTEVGLNVDQRFFQNIPTQRNFAAVILSAAGTAQDAVGVTVYGSTGSENAYYIDGVNTTGVERGTQGKVLNLEFVQEAQVKTGGYQAEYGRATGGVINVITKSGGNEFHGNAFGYYEGGGLVSELKRSTIDEANEGSVSSLVSDHKNQDYGVGLGGYLVKDKLWFFAAYNHVKNDEDSQVFRDFRVPGQDDYNFPSPGDVFVGETTRNLWSGKLTFRINDSHSVILSAFADPSDQSGPQPGVVMAAEPSVFLQDRETGGTDGVLKYEGVLGQNLLLNLQAATHKDKNLTGGAGLDLVRFYDRSGALYFDYGIPASAGGYGPAQRSEFGRDIYRGDLSCFLSNLAGDHELKTGIEYEDISVVNSSYNTGG